MDHIPDISNQTFSEFERVIEGLEREITARLPSCESDNPLHARPEMVSFRLGRAMGRLEGYRDYFYVTPTTGLQRRFLSRKVRPCLMTITEQLDDIHGLAESMAVAQPLRAWFELAMSDLGVDYESLD